MLLRQLFDQQSATYTYIVADDITHQAAIIDPVKEKTQQYVQLLNELGVTLLYALDTHVHADHVTALGALKDITGCHTMVGSSGDVPCATAGLEDNTQLSIGKLHMRVLFTPGHTSDSYCFFLCDGEQSYLFSGDTLLIRSTGRTDFQNGDPEALYDSIHAILLDLPADTIVLPGHDYKGWTRSTLAEEKQYNPRLQMNKQAFVHHMNNLKLADPKMMDIAVPANLACGQNNHHAGQ